MLTSSLMGVFSHPEIISFRLNVNLIPNFNEFIKFLSCVKFYSVSHESMLNKTYCQYNFSSMFRSKYLSHGPQIRYMSVLIFI